MAKKTVASPPIEAVPEPAPVPPTPMVKNPVVTPGKVALWLFLATEVMFFTGLIGSYVVMRAGSGPNGYSSIYSPASREIENLGESAVGLHITDPGPNPEKVIAILRPIFDKVASYAPRDLVHLINEGHAIVPGQRSELAEALASQLRTAGATVEEVHQQTEAWPKPYDHFMNPLSIDLTAVNTFILICSSVTMVLSLARVQAGDRIGMQKYLLATLVLGGVFLGVQVFEYRELMKMHVYPIGVSSTGHFVPGVSLFASCFFSMTGFHGAHVAGGIIALAVLLVSTLSGKITPENHSSLELTGLYWHFVDLVWIILFTVVYLI